MSENKTGEFLKKYLDYQNQNLPVGNPDSLYEPARYILNLGGKKIRPLLCILGYDLFSEDTETAFPLALASEVFHNFTLVHDDIMDNASLRRGEKTVHVKWDVNQAILTGDTMLVDAVNRLIKLNTTPDLRINILYEFTTMADEVCRGQQLDVEFAQKKVVSEEEYLEMIRLKTSVLLGFCLKSGALLGGASETDAQILYEAGIQQGIAFQIMDDLLDVFGESEFGKVRGGDILENKKTLLMLHLLNHADRNDVQEIYKWFELREPEHEKIRFFTELFRKYDSDAYVRNVMMEKFNEADLLLNDLRKSRDFTALDGLFTSLKSRQI
ncbi:MAG: polyprenyl synthetase family protein [Bacteroidetes bacterium]|nr:polyprenyl synthetase family protein [Bacteroidota bacterium]